MTIPLDRLYDHLDALSNHDLIIYRFVPHGSKKLENIQPIYRPQNWLFQMTRMQMICHDQEPLWFDHYSNDDYLRLIQEMPWLSHRHAELLSMKLRLATRPAVENAFDQVILLHSERNSSQLMQFEQHGMVGAYWWSHAMIAQDWYRYAQHDPALVNRSESWHHDFLIYNRAWSGSREYRLKFAEMLITHDLLSDCNVKFSMIDNDCDYRHHVFSNPALSITRQDIHKLLPANPYVATASADYVAKDYVNSAIEIVLETLFDDARHHLTEKTLRPIACGQPFMLMSTAGSLAYLRSYGFETFAPWIDETYDEISEPVARMHSVIKAMQQFTNQPRADKQQAVANMRAIAQRNRQRFFDPDWSRAVWQELCDNTNAAIDQVQNSRRATAWRSRQTRGESETWTFPDFKAVGDIDKFYKWLSEPQTVPRFTLAESAA